MLASLSIVFPTIDPIAFQVGPFSVHWYALSYVAGILLGWAYLHYLNKIEPKVLSSEALDDIMLWSVIGIILGGRIGYVLFYNLEYYIANPMDAIRIWQGGMSFHGGMIGVIFALFLFTKKYKVGFFPVIDLVACVTPIGLGLGRVANFINAELYGRTTESSLGVVFPGEELARHPSQLYEAGMEGILLLIIMYYLVHYTRAKDKPGALSGYFLLGYGFFRSIAELFREPDAHIGFVTNNLTMGQILSLPMLLLGIYLILRPNPKSKA